MDYYALIPVKSLSDAKSRLKGHLSLEERKTLTVHMLKHVLKIVHACKEIKQTFVVTPDEEIKKIASQYSATVLPEEHTGYNQSVTIAAKHVPFRHSREGGKPVNQNNISLLTIPADLPLLTQNDIQMLIKHSYEQDIVLAPSKDGGTNSVLMHPPLIIPYLFGKDSFKKYINEAQKRNLTISIYESPTIAFDIDTIDDLRNYY